MTPDLLYLPTICNIMNRRVCNDPISTRRSFLARIAMVFGWLLIPFQSRADDPPDPKLFNQGIALKPHDGEELLIGPRRAPVNIKIGRNNGSERLAMGTEDIAPGDRIPVHKHGNEDEIIFIHAGEGTATLGESRIPVKTGAVVFVPQGVWHGLENTGTEPLTMVWIFSPSGFEQYFRDIGVKPNDKSLNLTDDEWHKVDAKHAISYRR
jgi:quercetin dioxygenase-like cupin family protein